jgi:hypothetical protein
MPIWKKLKKPRWFSFLWKPVILFIDWIWWGCKKIMGPPLLAKIYYHYIGKPANEPDADELTNFCFQQDLANLRKTIIECIIKPCLYEKIQEYGRHIHIVEGFDDETYIPYTRLLFQQNPNVTLHRTLGDHHMIYHYPIETARKISSLIPWTNVYL